MSILSTKNQSILSLICFDVQLMEIGLVGQTGLNVQLHAMLASTPDPGIVIIQLLHMEVLNVKATPLMLRIVRQTQCAQVSYNTFGE